MPFDREQMKTRAAELAAKGVFIGTSSWKYPGWLGMLYDEQRYIYRGKFNETRFGADIKLPYLNMPGGVQNHLL